MEKQANPDPSCFCFLYFHVSLHTEPKCKFLSLSCLNPSVLHAQGKSLFQQQERVNIPLWVEPSSTRAWVDLSLSCSLQGWVVWLGGGGLGGGSFLRKHSHPSSQPPRGSSFGLPVPPDDPLPSEPPPHSRPPGPRPRGARPAQARGRGTDAQEAGPRSWASQPAPGAALSWKTFWLFVYIAARRSPATWLSPPAADSGPRPAPSAPGGLRAGVRARAAPARRHPAPLTIWWWWWPLGMLLSWKNVLRAVCGQTQRQGDG